MIDPTSKQPKFSQTNTRFVSLRAPKVPTSNLRDQNKTPATIIMETRNPCMQRSGQRRYTPPPAICHQISDLTVLSYEICVILSPPSSPAIMQISKSCHSTNPSSRTKHVNMDSLRQVIHSGCLMSKNKKGYPG